MDPWSLTLLILLILVILTATGIIVYLIVTRQSDSPCPNLITPIPTTITGGGQILGTVPYTGHPITEFGVVLTNTANPPGVGTIVSLYDGNLSGPVLGTVSTKSRTPTYVTTTNLQIPKTKTIVIGTGSGPGTSTDLGTANLVTLKY